MTTITVEPATPIVIHGSDSIVPDAQRTDLTPAIAVSNGHVTPERLSPEARYAANCEIIAKVRPEILHDLQRFPITNMQLGPLPCSDIGGQVWDVHKQGFIPLCHPDNPVAGAEADCDSVYSRDIKVYTLLGMGLGYFAVALAKRLRQWQRLVIFDLDPCMFKAALYAVDIAPLFPQDGRRIDIFVGDQITTHAVEPWFMNMDAREKLHLSMPLRTGYTSLYRTQEYDLLHNKVMEMLVFHAVGIATWRQFGSCIGDNDLLNLPEYYQSPGYEHLHDLWKDKPAVCVAAGPSLQRNLRYLMQPEIRSRVAVIAAGTTYALLHGLGLAPDIVTTIDFQRLNWTDQFQHIPLDAACPLVYLHSTYPQTPRRWPGPRFVAENASDTMNVFRVFGDDKKSAAIVQTVAHLNLLVALELGANPIMLVGQDLSMPLDSHHAAGARAQDQAPNEVAQEAFLDTVDFQGHPVKSRHSFMSMKTVFERIIAAHPDRTILNCSEAGLALAGARNVSLREAVTPVLSAPTLAPLRPVIAEVWQQYVPRISEELLQAVKAIHDEVRALGQMAHDVQAFVREMGIDTPAVQHWIMEHEAIIQANARGWGIFAIRDFRILELLGAIPPEEAFSADAVIRDRVSCQRMMQVAQVLSESVEVVERLMRLTLRRLEMMCDYPCVYNRKRLIALQLYTQADKDNWVSEMEWMTRLHAKYLYDTQQYDAALAVMRTLHIHPQRQARIQQRLAQFRDDVRTAMPAYFGSQPTGSVSPTEEYAM